MHKDIKIAIIGLGYVGLPLARLFATRYPVWGFDIDANRVMELRSGRDSTREVSSEALDAVLTTTHDMPKGKGLYVTDKVDDIRSCNWYIITVPTPVDEDKKPDLNPLISSSETTAQVLKGGDIVIYESTVFPGATEEICVPILERISGLKMNVDFHVGYSPERINPGDSVHTVDKILKVTSGSTPEIAREIDALYASVIEAWTHLAPSIKVAEAAKVIENSQRDINIAFVNELAKIFNRLGIDTQDVLEAAGTKWNFLHFKPGLVGGHCIGVDPYYLAQRAQEAGYHPEIILAGRKMNDGMGQYVASEVVKLMSNRDLHINGARILVLGITFKENCVDVRNTKVVDLIKQLEDYGTEVVVHDPWADPDEVRDEYGLETFQEFPDGLFEAVVLAVAHEDFSEIDFRRYLKPGGVIYDVKGVISHDVDGRL
jgi:UDP-N-acetyl-D-galactosamine dehydrogenase